MQDSGVRDEAVAALQVATRDLLALALRSLDAAPGLAVTHTRLLFAVDDHPGQPLGVLAEALGVSASSVTRHSDRLVRSGHLKRTNPPANRSVVQLTLTAKGRRALDQVTAHRAEAFRGALAGIDPEVLTTTVQGLSALHEGFAAARPGWGRG